MSNQKILQNVTKKSEPKNDPDLYLLPTTNYTLPKGLTSSSLTAFRKSKKFKIATDT